MANELLDFVMKVVGDPAVAAQYAADPAQAIADAHLTDVTSADVNSLIPLVSESLSTGAHTMGTDVGADSNVWASGAATAAFDAFSDYVPGVSHVAAVEDPQHVISDLPTPVDHPFGDAGLEPQTVDAGEFDHPAGFDDFHIDDSVPETPIDDAVDHTLIADHDLGVTDHGFDIFD
jgi:hypothetical protein